MARRRWFVLIVIAVVAAIAATLLALPELVRQVAINRIRAITDRPASIDRVELNLLSGRIAVHGFRLAERGGEAPFADFERLDLRVHLPSLLRGHLWLREAVLRNSSVRVVRLPTNEFNLSDLIKSSGTTGRTFDVTVDHFALVGGTVTLEDRALPEARTWTSEKIAIEAHNLSTRRDDGTAVGTSVTAGAPVSVEVQRLRLYPIHLQATLTVEGLDVTLARVYLPPDAPVVLDRGRASKRLQIALDARDGLQVDGTGRLEDVALVRSGTRETVAVVPALTVGVTGFGARDGALRLKWLEIAGSGAIRDPRLPRAGRLESLRASLSDLTWPINTPARLELASGVPGGGKLDVTGTLQPAPAPSDLRLRLVGLDLAPWAAFLPASVRITGVAEADLRVNEPLTAGVPARIRGAVAVKGFGVADVRQKLLEAERIEATGLEVRWPARFTITRLFVNGPRGQIERDQAGGFPARAIWSEPAPAAAVVATGPAPGRPGPASAAPALGVEVGAIVVRGGAVAWRDAAVTPPARLDFSRIEGTVTGVAWPLTGPAAVRVALRPPRGGVLRLAGRLGIDPLTADVRVAAKGVDLEPYHSYVPTAARVSGWTDLDVAVVWPAPDQGNPSVRGGAVLSGVDVRDGQRTVLKIDRAAATGLDIEWPRRIAVGRLDLQRPWILLERDDKGALALRALLTPPKTSRGPIPGAASTEAPAVGAGEGEQPIAVTVARLTVEDGGARLVDRGVSPPFAVDIQRVVARMEGVSTLPAPPARMDLRGQLVGGADVALSGTLGSLGGPLALDVNGDLRQFAIPRANPYLLRHVDWKAREGWLTTKLRCRIRGDKLDAKTDIRLSQLQLTRAGNHDEAQARVGLPLGLIVALLKDRRGDINVSLPVGGRLNDPRFDFNDAIWSAVRTVAINAITLPVSWIGRVKLGSDSRIDEIQVDPIRFQPGTPTLTAEGQGQVARIAAFLQQLPEVRLTLTPVVSAHDLAELRRQAIDAAIERITREAQVSSEVAAARLFEQRFPRQQPPGSLEAIRAALLESEPPPAAEVPGLARKRVEAVRATLKQAEIDPARLLPATLVEAPEGRIDVALAEADTSRRRGLLGRLRELGATITGDDAAPE